MGRPRKSTTGTPRKNYTEPVPEECTPLDTPMAEPSTPNGNDGDEESKPESPVTDEAAPVEAPQYRTPQPPLRRKRGRPSRAFLQEEAARNLLTPTKESTPMGDLEGADDGSDMGTPMTGGKKRRGRPPALARNFKSRGGPSHVTHVPLDKDGNPQEVDNDEIVLTPDPAGERKVDADGHLKDGREYRCRTFTIKGRGPRLYMLSTEPARCIGFRDSYLFFQKHKQLFKIIMDDEEKYDMIGRGLIPHSYKGRAIGVVTARSVFREFGARIIVGGRKVIDDYWEARERAEGAVEGELADPNDKVPAFGTEYNRNQYVAWHGASSVYHTGQPSVPMPQVQGRKKRIVVTDENWMFEHAMAASRYNSTLAAQRKQTKGGVYEPHTNINFYPQNTQPTRFKWEKIQPPPPTSSTSGATSSSLSSRLSKSLTITNGTTPSKLSSSLPPSTYTIETQVVTPAYGGASGGLMNVNPDILEALRKEFGDEVYMKAKKQVEGEREWERRWMASMTADGG